jgi:16S rRNA (cytosine1402-N4)-methyltransferase
LINHLNNLENNLIDLKQLKNQKTHFPVLINEIILNLNLLNTKPITILDCTFGAGGYSEQILKYNKINNNENISVIAIDRDESVLKLAESLKILHPNNFKFALKTFGDFPEVLKQFNLQKVDAIIMDIGISTMQLKQGRGFSFKYADDLSMQMGLNNISAKDFVNKATDNQIADVLYYYGEEHKAKSVAKAIIKARNLKEIQTTKELADIITLELTGSLGKNYKINPATKSFQAIRIYVNNELGELKNALSSSLNFLNIGGKLMVVSFHSLEDRIVKDFFNEHGDILKTQKENKNIKFTNYKENKDNIENKALSILTKKPITPSMAEGKINPPSLSAKLRVAIKN